MGRWFDGCRAVGIEAASHPFDLASIAIHHRGVSTVRALQVPQRRRWTVGRTPYEVALQERTVAQPGPAHAPGRGSPRSVSGRRSCRPSVRPVRKCSASTDRRCVPSQLGQFEDTSTCDSARELGGSDARPFARSSAVPTSLVANNSCPRHRRQWPAAPGSSRHSQHCNWLSMDLEIMMWRPRRAGGAASMPSIGTGYAARCANDLRPAWHRGLSAGKNLRLAEG
jgi:hypothetical protein